MYEEKEKLKKHIEKIEISIKEGKADQKMKDCGICALSIFAVLHNIAEVTDQKHREGLWNNIKEDVIVLNEELEKMLENK